MTRADTIARHLFAFETHLRTVASGVDVETRTSAVPDAVAALREAFAVLDGGAAVAGEANGPPEPAPPDEEPSAEVLAADDSPDEPSGLWVVKTPTGWFRGAGLSDARVLARARRFPQRRDAVACAIDTVGVVLTLAEAEQAEPPKPYKAPVSVLPVDAAGNVIEAADIGATLRREECERKAARQSGVAWEAARAGEEAERLRTELAAVKAERDKVLSNAAVLDTSLRRLRADRDAFKARASARAETLECERDSLREHLSNARAELAAVKAERDALNAAEADLRHALRQIAELVGGAVSLGASTDMHCAVANEVRVVVADLRAERDALAAEVRRSREQKPVHLALVDKQGAVVDGYLIKTRALAEDDARRRACTVAPLYLAPVVRDHSGVIAQCEEALREWDSKGAHCSATSSMVAVTLTKARNALRGAS